MQRSGVNLHYLTSQIEFLSSCGPEGQALKREKKIRAQLNPYKVSVTKEQSVHSLVELEEEGRRHFPRTRKGAGVLQVAEVVACLHSCHVWLVLERVGSGKFLSTGLE